MKRSHDAMHNSSPSASPDLRDELMEASSARSASMARTSEPPAPNTPTDAYLVPSVSASGPSGSLAIWTLGVVATEVSASGISGSLIHGEADSMAPSQDSMRSGSGSELHGEEDSIFESRRGGPRPARMSRANFASSEAVSFTGSEKYSTSDSQIVEVSSAEEESITDEDEPDDEPGRQRQHFFGFFGFCGIIYILKEIYKKEYLNNWSVSNDNSPPHILSIRENIYNFLL